MILPCGAHPNALENGTFVVHSDLYAVIEILDVGVATVHGTATRSVISTEFGKCNIVYVYVVAGFSIFSQSRFRDRVLMAHFRFRGADRFRGEGGPHKRADFRSGINMCKRWKADCVLFSTPLYGTNLSDITAISQRYHSDITAIITATSKR